MRLNRTCEKRKGNVAVIVAISMVAILSLVALTLDGGMILDKRRQTQATADAAAYAAACQIYSGWFTDAGLDPSGLAAALAQQVASDNGFANGQNNVVVTVNIPPQSGLFIGRPGYVEVVISMLQPRGFSAIFGSNQPIPVGARAVARGMRTTVNNGIIVLDPTASGSLTDGGGGVATVTGGAPVIVNSNSPTAMIANGNGGVVAPVFNVAGSPGFSTVGTSYFQGTINPNIPPTPDPLRFIPEPNPANLPVESSGPTQITSSKAVTLYPGVYVGGISVSGKGNVILEPGVYYMEGGGFTFTGQGSLTGIGVMIYNAPQSKNDVVSLAGNGAITLSPPTMGPYQGMTIFQQRDTTIQPKVSVTGSGLGSLDITGTFYVPKGQLSITGNGVEDTIGAQYISDTLSLGGNGTFNVNWNPAIIPGIRSIYLVE